MFSDNILNSNRILYTPSVFAKSTLLYLQETGTLTATKPEVSARNNLASFLFFTVLEGEGVLNYKNKRYHLKTGDCVFINCEQPYSHSAVENHLWKIQWVHFYGENLPGIYVKYLERGGQNVFHSDNIDAFSEMLNSIYVLASSEDYLRDMQINTILSTLLTRIMEMTRQPEKESVIRRGTGKEYTLQDIKDYIEENWTKKIVLDELAEKFFINKFYLTRLFKNQYGTSILNYVMKLRITYAKKQLRFTDKTVETIGYECGFADANYFSRKFKNVEGISPIEYRKKWVDS